MTTGGGGGEGREGGGGDGEEGGEIVRKNCGVV